MTGWWYFLPINPEPWRVGPLSVGRKSGALFPAMGRDQQLHAYKEAVKEALMAAGPVWVGGDKLRLSIWFWRTRADYQTHQARAHRKHEADCTNMFKATEDACQGILFENDKNNIETHGYIVEQGPNVSPFVVINLAQVDIEARENMERAMLSAMPDSQREQYHAIRALQVTDSLLSRNATLPADDGWEPGDF